MKKDLRIEMDEECIECPMLSLETVSLWLENRYCAIHRCEHLDFCKRIRTHWEEVRNAREEANE